MRLPAPRWAAAGRPGDHSPRTAPRFRALAPIGLLLAALLLAPGWDGEPAPLTASAPQAALPRATPAEAYFDPPALQEAVQRIGAQEGVQGLLVLRQGRLVAEEYWRGEAAGRPQNIKSASKGILSALVGIAIDEGLLQGVDQPIAPFFPGLLGPDADPRKQGITLGQLLSMTAGLETTSLGNYGAWMASGDWVRHALTRKLLHDPGRRFIYSTGNSHLLSAILTRVAGMGTHRYAELKLLGPAGIEVGSWDRDPQGIDFGGNNVSLTLRDMARLGQLYLDRGRLGDRQLVPSSWVEDSTKAVSEGWPDRYGRYGYLWWIPPPQAEGRFMAVGYGGQFIYVAPAEEVVIALASTLAGKGRAWDREMLSLFDEGILGSARGRRGPGTRVQ